MESSEYKKARLIMDAFQGGTPVIVKALDTGKAFVLPNNQWVSVDKSMLNDIIDFCSTPRSMAEIMERLGLKHRYNVKHRYIDPLIEGGFLVMTIPEKPNSRDQKYKRALT